MPNTPDPDPVRPPGGVLPPRHEVSPWSARYLDAIPADQVPEFRSPAWDALPVDDPRRIVAVVVAAERWAAATDPAQVADRLALELAARRDEVAVGEQRWADAVGWAAASRERVEGIVGAAVDRIGATAAPGPVEVGAGRVVVDSPGWPVVVRPGEAVVAARAAAVRRRPVEGVPRGRGASR